MEWEERLLGLFDLIAMIWIALMVLGVIAVSLAALSGILYLVLAACATVGTTNGRIPSVMCEQVVDDMFVEHPCSLRDWLLVKSCTW